MLYIFNQCFLVLFYLFTNLIQMLDLKSCLFSKDGHAFSYLHTHFHLPLTHPFTITYTPISYTPITSINTPFWLSIFHIFISHKLQPNTPFYHLLFFHLLSSLFHNHKTFHFFSTNPNPSRINTSFSFYFFYLFLLYFHLLSSTYICTS